MKLTLYTDYSLRVMMYLGINSERLCTVAEIAQAFDISRHHLTRIVLQLGRGGYVETVRGRNGGLRLRMAPEQVGIGQLVRKTEPDLAIAECFKAPHKCPLTPSCTLKRALRQALGAFLEVLDQYTLKDLLKPEGELRELLSGALQPT